jgi:putative flippase GtrA
MHVRGIATKPDAILPCSVTLRPGIQALCQKRFTQELRRYFLVSVMALGSDIGVLLLMKEGFGLHYLSAAALGFSVGLVIAYICSIRWAFRYRRQADWQREFILFAAIGICGLMLNEGIMWAVTDGLDVNYSGSKLIAAGGVFLFNFYMRKTLLFSPEEQ